MPSSSADRGLTWIVMATIGVSAIISKVTGSYSHWPFVVLGLIVGLMAAQSINR